MLPHFAQVSWRPSEYFMLRDGALSRPTKYLMLQEEALWRATEYLLQLRKYYDGRQSTSAFCASIVAADRIFKVIIIDYWYNWKIFFSFFLFLFFHFYLSRHIPKTLLAGQSLGSLNFTLTSTSSISSSIRNLSRWSKRVRWNKVPLSCLRPWACNRRKHSRRHAKGFCKSLGYFH